MLKGISAFFVVFALSATLFKTSFCDDFPSLLTANASIAIILDREYLDNQYDDTLKEIKVKHVKVIAVIIFKTLSISKKGHNRKSSSGGSEKWWSCRFLLLMDKDQLEERFLSDFQRDELRFDLGNLSRFTRGKTSSHRSNGSRLP